MPMPRRLSNAMAMAARGSRRGEVRANLEGDLVGPRATGPASFEELEELFLGQLAPRLRLRCGVGGWGGGGVGGGGGPG